MKTNKMMNKKGIGFGRMLVITVLVLLGLSIWIMTVSIPKVGQSIGTDSTNLINKIELFTIPFPKLKSLINEL
jgi:hypothetical protein